MLSVGRIALLCAAFGCAPLLIFLALLVWPLYLALVAFNLCRAARWKPLGIAKLATEVIGHVLFMLAHTPLFASVLWYYVVVSPREGMRGSIPFPYSSQGRLCKLDVYAHKDGKLRDCVMFVYGGAWGSGKRWYYSRLAAIIRDACDAVVVVPEYPTHPNATIHEMTECIHAAARWCEEHIERFGGNGRLWLVGHSAGAHLVATLLVRSAMAISSGTTHVPEVCSLRGACDTPVSLFGCSRHGPRAGATPPTKPLVEFGTLPRITGAVLFCGVYDLVAHLEFERRRGVDRISPMTPATDGYWEAVSPTLLLRALPPIDETPEHVKERGGGAASGSSRIMRTPSMHLNQAMFPPLGIHLVHASHDRTVDVEQSLDFRSALMSRGMTKVPPVQRINCSHADVVLGPLLVQPTSAKTIHPTVIAIATAMHGQQWQGQ